MGLPVLVKQLEIGSIHQADGVHNMAFSMAGLASAMSGYNQGLSRVASEEAATRNAALDKIKYDQAILDQKNKTGVDGIFGDGDGLASAPAKVETNGQHLINSAMGLFSAKNPRDTPAPTQPTSGGLNSKLATGIQEPDQSSVPAQTATPNTTIGSPVQAGAATGSNSATVGSEAGTTQDAAPSKTASPVVALEQPYKPIFSHAPQMQAKLDAWAALPENAGKDAMYRQAQDRIDAIAKIEQSKAHQERMSVGENGLQILFLENDVSGINKLMRRDMPVGKNYVLKNDLEGSGYTIYDGDKPVNKFADRDALGKAVSMRLHPELYQSASAEAQKAGMVESAKLPSIIEQETVKARVKGEADIKTAIDTGVVEKNNADAFGSRQRGNYYQAEAGSIKEGKGNSLTLPQQRTNYEIDAARKSIAGMTPQEIAHRTAKATNTGRENPDYDPNLARQARIAATRKIGDDGEFDGAGDPPESVDAPPRSSTKSTVLGGKPIEKYTDAELTKLFGTKNFASQAAKAKIDTELTHRTFSKDSSMSGNTLGESTPNGYKVLDKSGKHIGYYAR
jgi:hypothetical protein